jgi:hypothetical protein
VTQPTHANSRTFTKDNGNEIRYKKVRIDKELLVQTITSRYGVHSDVGKELIFNSLRLLQKTKYAPFLVCDCGEGRFGEPCVVIGTNPRYPDTFTCVICPKSVITEVF